MDHLELQPHIKLSPASARPVAIVVGDPARATALAKLGDSFKPVADNREYRSFHVTSGGVEVVVISHGVGSGGAAICFEELLKAGTKTIIRAGTCGSLQPGRIKQGDVAIIYAAAPHSTVTDLIVPKGYPCVADPETHRVLMAAAQQALGDEPDRLHEGTALSSDVFYQSPLMEGYLHEWQKANIDVVEMEIGVLFSICRLRKGKAAAIVTVDGCPMEWSEGNYMSSPERLQDGKTKMLKASLAAAVQLTKNSSS